MTSVKGDFLTTLGDVFGTVSLAEYIVRRTRDLGLMHANARGRGKVWTVDDLAAIVLMALLYSVAGPARADAEHRARFDPVWRDAVLGDIRRALRFGDDVGLDLCGGLVAVTVTVRRDAVVKLASLVDDWGAAPSAKLVRGIRTFEPAEAGGEP